MKRFLVAILTASVVLLGSANIYAAQQAGKKAVQKEVKRLKQNQLNFTEALKAIAYTDKAIELLGQKKKKEAVKVLEKATKAIDSFLKKHENLSMLPVDQQIVVITFNGDLKTAKSTIKKVKEMLEKGRVQDAKYLLSTLTDEIDVVNTFLPIEMYRHVLKLAIKDINENKINSALDVLSLVRGGLVVQKIVIPTPFLRAEAYIEQAQKVASSDEKKALGFVEKARKQLKLAQVLGYAYDFQSDYSDIEKQLSSVEKALKRGGKTESIFKELKKKIKKLGSEAETRK